MCGFDNYNFLYCFSSVNKDFYVNAQIEAERECLAYRGITHCFGVATEPFVNECAAVEAPEQVTLNDIIYVTGKTRALTEQKLASRCPFGHKCSTYITACDTTAQSAASAATLPPRNHTEAASHQVVDTKTPNQSVLSKLADARYLALLTAAYVLGIIGFAALLYIFRTPIANFIIHDRLPFELPVYGESIQALFKRTQRVNWYGRVVFGIVANLSMTKDELAKVRRYWLGRVIAFDSLRRQRQNELARMHLQLATSVKTEAKDKKALSQLWALIKAILLSVFYLFRALFSFLFGFLFIRITIAKLVRGTVIESKDLVLILQAKGAIEETANYLKEYIATANTFDGSDEIYDAK